MLFLIYRINEMTTIGRFAFAVTCTILAISTVSCSAQNESAETVLATEIFRCRGGSDGITRKLDLEYLQSRMGIRSGKFMETLTYLGKKGKETKVERGTFEFSGADYDFSYRNPDLGLVKLQVQRLDDDLWWQKRSKYNPEYSLLFARKTKYTLESPLLEDASTLIEYISPQRRRAAEDYGGDTNGLSCNLVKPIFATESFEDYSIDDPELLSEQYPLYYAEPAYPQFAGRDSEFRYIRTRLTEAVKDHRNRPKFGKYYLVVLGGKWGSWSGYLVDMRSGKVFEFFNEIIDDGMIIDYSFRENSNLLLSITVDFNKDYCHLNYSKWQNNKLVKIKHEVLGPWKTCLSGIGISYNEDYLMDIESKKIGE